MQLNSLEFIGFFVIVFAAHWALPHKFRTPLIFISSLYFYSIFGVGFTALLLACITFTYFVGIFLEKHKSRRNLTISIIIALSPLLFIKYFDFITGIIGDVTKFEITPLRLLQPLGISYFTFQMISYLVDVYKGKQAAEKDFFVCGLFLCFFPQVISGPMTRPRDLAGQYKEVKTFKYEEGIGAAQLILLGFFKKMLVADNLSYYTSAAFKDPANMHSLSLVIIVFFYSIQIYADFSGYTDMARGFARLVGIRLTENFRQPYFSSSIKEFWSRWHISLSSWLSEYLYIPLGGSRVSPPRHLVNLFITFLISGLWHGATLNMLAWGALHGFYMVCGAATKGAREKLPSCLRAKTNIVTRGVSILFTFCLVAFAWIFFAAPTMENAMHFATNLTSDLSFSLSYIKESVVLIGLSQTGFLRLLIWIGCLFAVDLASRKKGFVELLSRKKWAVVVCYIFAVLIIMYGSFGDNNFIYFKF